MDPKERKALLEWLRKKNKEAEKMRIYHWERGDDSSEDFWASYRQAGRRDAFDLVIKYLRRRR